MSPKMARAEPVSVDTANLAWLPSLTAPLRPKSVPSQVPDVAICTAPGCGSVSLQQAIAAPAAVESIAGCVHQLATRSDTEPSSAETSCQGGTCSAEGLEIRRTPV